jgi:hypothetical protein
MIAVAQHVHAGFTAFDKATDRFHKNARIS